MKILLYSQHVLGVGHFFRSMQIAHSLAGHEVLFAEGGQPLQGFVPPPHVKRLALPPIRMDDEFKHLDTGGQDLESIKAARKKTLMEAFTQFSPDVLITELFPFGRKAFRFELMPILEEIQRSDLATKVVCSLRDILVEKRDQKAFERKVIQTLNSFYDLLLIHSDPALVSLDETFSAISEIRVPIHYTGFIVKKLPGGPIARVRGRIIASSGGGKVGADLLASCIRAVKLLPEREIELRVFIGPFMEEDHLMQLKALAATDSRIKLLPFSENFLTELASAELSVSMGGYNTCMDILSSGVKALVYPFPQNREQRIRAEKLEGLQVLRIVKNLDADLLADAILEALKSGTESSRPFIDLSGASNTGRYLEQLLGDSPTHGFQP